MEQFASHWTDFHEIWCFEYFSKICPEDNVSTQSDMYNQYFTWSLIDISDHILLNFSQNEKCLGQNLATFFFFRKSCRSWYRGKILYSRAGHRLQHVSCAVHGRIPLATNTNSEYVRTYCFSTATTFARTRLSVPFHVLCLPCLKD
jgi:hypothetical protein